jgi:hypothetical protein
MNQYRSLENRIRDVVRLSRTVLREGREQIEKDSSEQIVAGTYKTKHFEICPGAQKVFSSLPRDTNSDHAEKAAILHDQLFGLEKQVISKERSTDSDIEEAGQIVDKIRIFADKMNISDKVNYLDDHIKIIKKYRQEDGRVMDKVTDKDMKRLQSPPVTDTKEKHVRHTDSLKTVSSNIKAQRKLKIIDSD